MSGKDFHKKITKMQKELLEREEAKAKAKNKPKPRAKPKGDKK